MLQNCRVYKYFSFLLQKTCTSVVFVTVIGWLMLLRYFLICLTMLVEEINTIELPLQYLRFWNRETSVFFRAVFLLPIIVTNIKLNIIEFIWNWFTVLHYWMLKFYLERKITTWGFLSVHSGPVLWAHSDFCSVCNGAMLCSSFLLWGPLKR